MIPAAIQWQFDRHGCAPSGARLDYPGRDASLGDLLTANQRLLGSSPGGGTGGDLADMAGGQIRTALALDVPCHIRGFLAGAVQHQYCTSGVTPAPLAWEYLQREPSQAEIIPGMEGRQRTHERRKALWRIP